MVDSNYLMSEDRNRFKKGDVVYWCHRKGHYFSVAYGRVSEEYYDTVAIDYLETKETRLINGVPIDEWKNEDQKFKKLPKGWSYDTQLYEITMRELTEEEKEFIFDIRDPESIKVGYDKGFLVKASTKFHGVVEADITKEGYKILKKHPYWSHHIDYTTVLPYKLYFTYEEALQEVEAEKAKFIEQANMSDYDWAVKEIDRTIDRWKAGYGASDDDAARYREWFLTKDDIEEIDIRVSGGELQWKYGKNKRWMNIEA